MIINICGAWGQGKSQVLAYLKEQGFQVELLLPELTKPRNMQEFCNFQNDLLIYRDRLIKEHKDSNTNNILIIESSFIDMLIYSLLVVGITFDHNEWIDHYYELCMENQKKVDLAINLPVKHLENFALPRFAVESYDILLKHYQNKIDSCKVHDIHLEYKNPEEYTEQVCEEVHKIIQDTYEI
jgi:broad-specificity NMP kinase